MVFDLPAKKDYTTILAGSCFLWLPVYILWADSGTRFIDATLIVCIWVGIILLGRTVCRRSPREIPVSINDVDGMLLLIAGYWMINLLTVIGAGYTDLFALFQIAALALLYSIVRQSTSHDGIIDLIILSGVLQSILMLVQYAGPLRINHDGFTVTGSFPNPGLTGGYLAIVFTFALERFVHWLPQRRARTGFYFCCLICLGVALACTESRAGWLAALSAAGWILYPQMRMPGWGKAMIVTLAGAVLPLLYLLRPESVHGRLLVWRCSWDMFCSAPFFGSGVGSFQREYMYHQAAYFAHHSDSPFTRFSDNVIYPFNEPLKILTEQGLAGFLLFAVLILLLFKMGRRGGKHVQKGVFAPILAFVIFSLFSYPSNSLLLLSLPIVALAMLRPKPLLRISLPSGYKYLFGLILALFFATTTRQYILCRQWNLDYRVCLQHKAEGQPITERFADDFKLRLLFRNNYTVSQMFLECLPEMTDGKLAIYLHCLDIFPSSTLCTEIGELYEQSRQYDRAETYYRLALNMNPDRITPAFRLFELYRKTGRQAEARVTAARILSTEYRIVSTDLLRMKGAVRRYYDKGEMP